MHRSTVKKLKLNEFLSKENHHLLYDIFNKPLLTEKTTRLELTENTMCFIVPDWADKVLIEYFISKVFKVKVLSVRVINTKSKLARFNQGRQYKTKTFKKAMVRVDSIKNASINFNNFLKEDKNEK